MGQKTTVSECCPCRVPEDSRGARSVDLRPVLAENQVVLSPIGDRQTGVNSNADQSSPTKKFETGAVRSSDADSERFDLISPIALRRLARTCAEGAAKYGEHNWLKGIPVSDLLNHAIRHIVLFLLGDSTEDHLAHAMWNLMAAIHFDETRPDMVESATRFWKK